MSGRGKPSRVQSNPPTNRLTNLDLAIGLGLILSIFAVYSQVSHFDFVDYDDDVYVYKNVHVQAGLTPASIAWAFSAVVSNNWMPVTLLSHILDVQFFGMQSGMQHLVNVLFHALSTLLLFATLQRSTGARWASAFVAFVFALHPLHVGSVAWIAERKDVLSGFFFFLGLYLYVRYTEQPSAVRYLLVAASFCLGLMAKPMLVTFPFVLLLFDLWPLRRLRWPASLWEKLPLFALSGVSAAVTYFVQRTTGSVDLAVPFAMRMENALLSYLIYLGQTFWPVQLAVFYPFPKSIVAWQALSACAVILGISAVAVLTWRTRPYLTMGWLWYLGTLVPVIGVVQVGLQSHADRYTYLPMVGIAVMVAWSAADALQQWPRTKPAVITAAIAICVLSMAAASAQASYWQNSETLFQRAIDVTQDNWVAERNLGGYLLDKGRNSEAITHLEAAVRLDPTDADAHNNLGVSLLQSERTGDAAREFTEVLRIKPNFAEAHFNLALALSKIPDRATEAVAQYEAALRLNPDQAVVQQSLGLLLVKLGHTEEAVTHLETAVHLNPDYSGEYNLGVVLLNMPGRQSEAIAHLEMAQRFHPDPEVAKTIDRLKAGRK